MKASRYHRTIHQVSKLPELRYQTVLQKLVVCLPRLFHRIDLRHLMPLVVMMPQVVHLVEIVHQSSQTLLVLPLLHRIIHQSVRAAKPVLSQIGLLIVRVVL
jgi:hypothetical protein